jgi:hypothetical protein
MGDSTLENQIKFKLDIVQLCADFDPLPKNHLALGVSTTPMKIPGYGPALFEYMLFTMIVPHTLFKKEKATSPVFLALIRNHLHLVSLNFILNRLRLCCLTPLSIIFQLYCIPVGFYKIHMLLNESHG